MAEADMTYGTRARGDFGGAGCHHDMRNEPNLRRFWAENGGSASERTQSKPIWGGREQPPSQMSDVKSQIAPRSGRVRQTKPICGVLGRKTRGGRENKANSPRWGSTKHEFRNSKRIRKQNGPKVGKAAIQREARAASRTARRGLRVCRKLRYSNFGFPGGERPGAGRLAFTGRRGPIQWPVSARSERTGSMDAADGAARNMR